jgi:hypothetical protein
VQQQRRLLIHGVAVFRAKVNSWRFTAVKVVAAIARFGRLSATTGMFGRRLLWSPSNEPYVRAEAPADATDVDSRE